MDQKSQKLTQLRNVISFYRGLILDDVEQELAHSPRWPYVRSRLLKYLGDRGLEGHILETIQEGSSSSIR